MPLAPVLQKLLRFPEDVFVRHRLSLELRVLLEDLALAAVDGLGNPDVEVDEVVTLAAAVHPGNSLSPDLLNVPRLRTGIDPKLLLAVRGVDFDLGSKRCLGERDRLLRVNVVVAARESGVLLDVDEDVQIAGRATVGARLPFSSETQARARVDTGRRFRTRP